MLIAIHKKPGFIPKRIRKKGKWFSFLINFRLTQTLQVSRFIDFWYFFPSFHASGSSGKNQQKITVWIVNLLNTCFFIETQKHQKNTKITRSTRSGLFALVLWLIISTFTEILNELNFVTIYHISRSINQSRIDLLIMMTIKNFSHFLLAKFMIYVQILKIIYGRTYNTGIIIE